MKKNNNLKLIALSIALILNFSISAEYLYSASLTNKKNVKKLSVAHEYIQTGKRYFKTHQYKRAFKYLETALNKVIKKYGKYNLEVAKLSSYIALKYQKYYLHKEAVEHFRKTISIRIKLLGRNHNLTKESVCNSVNTLVELKRFKKTKDCLDKLLKFFLEQKEKNYKYITGIYDVYSKYYIKRAKYNLALKYAKKSLKLKLKVFGKKSKETAKSYFILGIVLCRIKQFENSEKYFKKCLTIIFSLFGEKHEYIFESYGRMSLLYLEWKKVEKAMNICNKAIRIGNKIFYKYHTNIAGINFVKGTIYLYFEKYYKALKYCQKALQIAKNNWGDGNKKSMINLISFFIRYVKKEIKTLEKKLEKNKRKNIDNPFGK